ncbi:ATP-binding protein [Streptomyces sp. GB4-14]|uniref:RNA-binding domain-containing protein n=1 Tax=Streptomyces sp. GB4-14 TaxID=2498703 RepID=UPI001F5E7A52|nr:ATP-binding protein [Streptomyces sp. GB4-14]
MNSEPWRLTQESVREMLRNGESQTVEFKATLTNATVAAKEIAAMANSGGGFIFVGVDINGNPTGLDEKSRSRAQELASRVAGSIFPSSYRGVQLYIGEYPINRAIVLALGVPDLPEKFRPIRTADGSVYVRRNDHVVRVSLSAPPAKVGAAEQKELKIFVAMSFQVDREPALVDYYHAMRRAIGRSGIKCRVDRVDEVPGDYEVTAKIEEMITSADVVIADFTLNSPNVYYEAGIARGAQVYTIRTARKDTEIPFDVGTKKFILYANATELEESLIVPLQSAVGDL